MALSKDEIRNAAERLDHAEKTRTQIRQISLEHPGITIEDSYAIQKAWVDMKIAQGRTVKGHKIGLTSKAMQSALNIDEPDSGILLDDMFFADGGLVPTERFIATRVEAELAFVMKSASRRVRTAPCSMCSTPPTSWCRRWKSSTPGSSGSIRRPRRPERSSIPSPTSGQCRHRARRPPDPPDGRRPALDRRALLSQRPVGRDRAGGRRAQSSGDRRGVACQQDRAEWTGAGSRDKWCWRDRSSARSRPARATPSRPTTAPTAR